MAQTIGERFEEHESQLLRKVVKLRGENLSSFLRRAVLLELARLNMLPDDEERALGLQPVAKARRDRE